LAIDDFGRRRGACGVKTRGCPDAERRAPRTAESLERCTPESVFGVAASFYPEEMMAYTEY
jgi:hypothetical protein